MCCLVVALDLVFFVAFQLKSVALPAIAIIPGKPAELDDLAGERPSFFLSGEVNAMKLIYINKLW